MAITSQIFEAYLKCPSKCWFRSLGEEGMGNMYSDWVRERNGAYRADGIERLLNGVTSVDRAAAQAEMINMKTAKWKIAANFPARKENLESDIHIVERIPSEGRGKPARFTPVRFIFTNKLSKDDKLLLAYDAYVLSETLRRDVGHGKIVHGDRHTTAKVRTSPLAATVRKLTVKIATLLANDSPPELILNRHCTECEYQVRCRQKAIEIDDLSLLAGMTEKEHKKLNSKGIFTITQLSYTFRPRRRPKRLRDKREKYHHSLKALAIREKKIHIVGSPELKIEGTPVYLDVEGLPDRDFYYLIGVRFRNGESVEQHSLWADGPEDEERIWTEFLKCLDSVDHPVLICYGSYETVFTKAMCGRYGGPSQGSVTENAISSIINLLSIIYGSVYFPVPSNGLKEIAGYCGFRWSEAEASGVKSVIWREQWEVFSDRSEQKKLVCYNAEDCEALELLTDTIRLITTQKTSETAHQIGAVSIIQADLKPSMDPKWHFSSPVSSLEYINSAAYWDYQRDRVYSRTGAVKQKPNKQVKRRKIVGHAEKTIIWKRSLECPACNQSFCIKGPERSKNHHEILFGHRSLKLRVIKYIFQTSICRNCGATFGIPDRFKIYRNYGWNLIAYILYQVVELYIPQRTVIRNLKRTFDFDLRPTALSKLKNKSAEYYAETRKLIFNRIVSGNLIHIDETRANIKGKTEFVWVIVSINEVAYFLSESREGEMAHKLLADFKGVLVSDFYTAYDSINCPQQKCLIHLMRDLNDEILNAPFDEEMKHVVVEFGNLLKPIIETIDQHGLKKHFLNKHLARVDHFYRNIDLADYQSEVSLKYKERFNKNREKLFTFLKYDNVSWNNNNAEHAIKAFANIRSLKNSHYLGPLYNSFVL